MNWLEIEQLLDRFWKGQTSLIEEQVLKSAFLRKDVPTHLQTAKTYFSLLEDQRSIQLTDKDFETKLLAQFTTKRTLFTTKFIGYAAGLLILISGLFFLLKNEINPTPNYTQLTQEEIEVAQKYMNLLAANFDKSISFSTHNLQKLNLLDKGSQAIRPYEESYIKQLKNLDKIELINQSFDQLNPLKSFETIKIKL